MKNGFYVADSDMHVMEPPDLWQKYIDPAYKHAAPVGLMDMRRDMRVRVKNRVLLRMGPVRPVTGQTRSGWKPGSDDMYAEPERRGWDAKSQVEAMDKEGLDLAILYPSRGLFVLGIDTPEVAGYDGIEPDFAAAIARAYNDWMHDFVKVAPGRLIGAGMVAPHDPQSAASEARRCVKELGFRSLLLAPGCVGRRAWHHPDYDPLWAELERLDVPIGFHGGGRTYIQQDFGVEIFDDLMRWHTLSQPLGLMTVAVSLTSGGVLERFPKLRVALLEGNCAWAQWLFHRLDEHYEWAGGLEAKLSMKPSEYFKRNCYLSVEADEAPAKQYIEWYGDDNLVFSTDYPHADSKYPKSVEAFLGLPLPEQSKRKILWNNWSKLYNIPVNGGRMKVAAGAARRAT